LLDAKEAKTPSWINDPQEWAEDNDEKDFKDFRYFVYDTEAKKRRGIACQLARAKGSAEIASEITQFIKQSFGQSVQGDPTQNDDALEEYVETTLAQEVQSFIVGAKVYRTYWEQRAYREKKGADKDFTGYTCAALIKMSKKNIARAIRRAQRKLESVANPETKKNVKAALKDAADKFNELDKKN
ncbi:MAG: hypothetical protein HN730_03065, partial [Bdellovibrionales bacterium]|nr:hypothetical protein [Bdellovibrionales bacterium]